MTRDPLPLFWHICFISVCNIFDIWLNSSPLLVNVVYEWHLEWKSYLFGLVIQPVNRIYSCQQKKAKIIWYTRPFAKVNAVAATYRVRIASNIPNWTALKVWIKKWIYMKEVIRFKLNYWLSIRLYRVYYSILWFHKQLFFERGVITKGVLLIINVFEKSLMQWREN